MGANHKHFYTTIEKQSQIINALPLKISTRRIKYLGIQLTREVMTSSKRTTNHCSRKPKRTQTNEKTFPCSWMGKINIVKMAILPKVIYRSNAIPLIYH